MIPTKLLFLSPAVLLTACISLPDVETPQGPPDGSPDSGTPPSVTLTLATPGGTTYTNSTVSIQLQVQGDTPEQVELVVDDQPLTTLQAPYTFSWDTTSVAEGSHRLGARARIGDKTFPSEVRDVVVDRTPPQVTSRTPTPAAQDISVRQPIQATFSEPLKASTLTNTSVKLFVGGTEVASTPSLSTDGKTLTIAPAASLIVPNPLQATLTAAVTDIAGNPLVIPSDLWAWSLPLSFPIGALSALPGNTDALEPFLQINSRGEPLVAWREKTDSGEFNIYASHWTGSDWEALGGAINSAPYNASSTLNLYPSNLFHMLRLDSTNNPIVAWIHPDGQEPGIYVKRWTTNQWMSVGTPLNAFPGTSSIPVSVSLSITTNDSPVVAWEQQNPSTSSYFIHVGTWNGQAWSEYGAPLLMSRQGGDARPVLALDRTNKPVVAWADYSSDRKFDGINVRRWNGSSWDELGSAVDANPSASTEASQPRLILDASDNPVIAWSETDGTANNVYARRWTGTTWEALGEALTAVPGATHAVSPDLAMDGHGNLFILWLEEAADKSSRANYIFQWTGTAWGAIGPPLQADTSASLAIDSSGVPFVAWASGDASSSTASVRIHRYNH